jgi:recombination protein RecA
MARPKKIKETVQEDFNDPVQQYFYESGESMMSKYGKDYVSSGAEEDDNLKYLYIPDLFIQWSLGRAGFALGRVMQIMGFEGAGKTSLALWIANQCMKAGGIAAMIETEQAASTEHIKNYLDNPKMFRIFHPESIEDALSMTLDQLNLFLKIDPEAKIPKVLILDSLAGATDQRAMKDEENFVQGRVGGSAKVIKDATNLIKGKLKETNTLWVVLNQGRDRLETGFAAMRPEIDKIIGSGGRAIPFAATYWVVLKKNAATKEGGEKNGFKVKGTWVKNKLRKPLQEFTYCIKWGHSFDFVETTTNMLAVANIRGFTEMKGGKFYSDELGITKENAMTAEQFYQFAHSPEQITKFQEELDILNTDTFLINKIEQQLNVGGKEKMPVIQTLTQTQNEQTTSSIPSDDEGGQLLPEHGDEDTESSTESVIDS